MPPSLLTNEMEELPTRESSTPTDESVAANDRILQMLQDMAAKQDAIVAQQNGMVRNQEKQHRRMDDLEARYARDIQDGSERPVSTSLVAGGSIRCQWKCPSINDAGTDADASRTNEGNDADGDKIQSTIANAQCC